MINQTSFLTHINTHFDFSQCMVFATPIPNRDCLRHVIPQWMQTKFGLQKRLLTFQTKHAMEYQNLLFPLSPEAALQGFDYLERVIADLFALGFEGLNWIKEEQLFQFLLRTFCGITYNEGYVAFQELKHAAQWMEGETGVRLQLLSHLLKGIAEPVTVQDFTPYSVFVYKMHMYEEPAANFDLKVNINTLCIAMRVGEIGIMASLLDNGTQRQFYGDYFNKFKQHPLHPIQFDELFARLSYKTYLMNNIYEYGITLPDTENKDTIISIRVPEDKKDVPVYKPWVDEVYSSLVSQYWKSYGIPPNEVYQQGRGVITFLENEQSEMVFLDPMGNETSA